MTQLAEAHTIPDYRAGTWQIDPSHSHIGFSVRHMMISKVRGSFGQFSGSITTAEELTDSSVDVSIEPSSIETGDAKRDAHLRSPDFFDTDTHPDMTYRAQGVTVDGDSYRLDGELSIKGITHTVPVTFELTGMGPDAYGGFRVGFEGSATINRHDFNVSWNQAVAGSGVVVGDKVQIHLEVQAVWQGE